MCRVLTFGWFGGRRRTLAEHDHWGIWWLPDLTKHYHSADLALPLSQATFTKAPPRGGREAIIYYDYDVLAITGT